MTEDSTKYEQLREAFASEECWRSIKIGAILIIAHVPYTVAVEMFAPEQLYLILIAPAGIVANFLLPMWALLIIGRYALVDRKTEWAQRA